MNCILKIKKIVSIFLVLAVIISVTTPNLVFASENEYDSNPLKEYEKLKIIKSDEFSNIATEKFNDLFKNEAIEFPKDCFDLENIKLAEMDGQIYATISKKDSALSTITISLNADKEHYVENYLYEKNGNFWVKIKDNGKLISEVDSEVKYVSNDEIVKGIKEINNYAIELQNKALDIPCFIAVSGAGGTVAGLIAKVCGMPCTLAPPVCVVCLGGIIIVGGGSILLAVWKCWG